MRRLIPVLSLALAMLHPAPSRAQDQPRLTCDDPVTAVTLILNTTAVEETPSVENSCEHAPYKNQEGFTVVQRLDITLCGATTITAEVIHNGAPLVEAPHYFTVAATCLPSGGDQGVYGTAHAFCTDFHVEVVYDAKQAFVATPPTVMAGCQMVPDGALHAAG